MDALLEEFFGSLACHPEIEPDAVAPGPWHVQPGGRPGEHAGQDAWPLASSFFLIERYRPLPDAAALGRL
jgi:hypothetical protein